MLRRSLMVFAGLVLVGLGATALYAVLQLRGPTDVLADAEGYLQAGDPTAAVSLLDQCESGLGIRDQPELRRQLWRLRLRANRALDNRQRALRDVEYLIGDGDPDPGLLFDRIYYLAVLGRGTEAKQRALDFLAAHPDSARGLELAGEACQVEYREQLGKVSEQVRGDLEYELVRRAQDAMLAYLYRPPGDESGTDALLELGRIYEQQPRRRQTWARLQETLGQLRERIQQALGYHQRALEQAAHARPDKSLFFAAAFRGVAFALQQGGRRDDVVAQAEIYRAGFDHRFTVEAAIAAAEAQLADGLWRAAVDVADRYLPPGTHRARIAARKLDAGVEPLLSDKALALFRLGAGKELERLAHDLRDMSAAGLDLPRAIAFAHGFAGILAQDHHPAEQHLAVAFNLLERVPVPVTGPDLFDIAVPLRLELMRKLAYKPDTIDDVIARWGRARRGSGAAEFERARLRLETGQATAAMTTASGILARDPRNEQALRLLARAADKCYQDSGQDGDGLLLQCLQRKVTRPDVPHPVCILLCGEAALKQDQLAVARECGRVAADHFPQARWPRSLQARALLASGDVAEAILVLDRAILADPDDRDALLLWFDTCRRQGLPLQPHLAAVVGSGIADASVAAALLRNALAADSSAPSFLARAAAARTDADAGPELLALAAQALAPQDQAESRKLLDRARALLGDHPGDGAVTALAEATLALLLAVAPATADADLAGLADAELRRLPLPGPAGASALLRAADRCDRLDRPRTACSLATAALRLRDAGELRDARSFLLAGRTALRLGQVDRAIEHLTAAISFPDGDAAAEPLARVLLLQGRPDRAQEAYAMASVRTDPALALRFAAPEAAFALARDRVARDPCDLLAQVVFALTTQVGPDAVGKDLEGVDDGQKQSIAELVALLAERGLADRLVPAARALATALPAAPTAQLLLARALADAGELAAAAAIHARVFADGCRESVLFGEAVRAATGSPYPFPAPIREALAARATPTADALPPVLQVFALRDRAAAAAVAGHPEVAVQIMAALWLRQPLASGATIANADALVRQDRARDAIALLDTLRQGAGDRAAAAAMMFTVAADHPPDDARLEAKLIVAAREQLAGDGPFGPPLRFLLAVPRRLLDIADADVQRWLEAVVTGAAAGTENMPFAVEALAVLARRHGRQAALATVERALAQHPEMVHFWVARAQMLAQERRAAEGIADARAALAFARAPELDLELLAIAGEERCLQPEDFERAAQLPKEVLDTAAGSYMRGLLALRQGKADEAEALLAGAQARSTGFHLYARALANLTRQDAAARAKAAELFAKFAADYPSSALARNAGSFARQLGVN